MAVSVRSRHLVLALGAAIVFGTLLPDAAAGKEQEEGPLTLRTRVQIPTEKGSGRYHTVVRETEWDPAKTAIVICDMWDKHWCPAATARVAEMAPRMNEVVQAARRRGALIIHCPSNTMDFYEGTPQRRLAQQAPPVETKIPLARWCSLDEQREGALPIDDKNGGCDSEPAPKPYKAWSRQIETIEFHEGDAITDSAEAFYLMKQRGIENLIVMGVHTNMCVLGRPFSIRQMVYQGLNVVLMRDMTDTMYDPKQSPFVSHFTGTDLVVEHIERHWCPTITSVDFLGGKPFRFEADRRKHLVVVISEPEYRTEESLPPYVLEHFGKDFRISLVYGNAEDGSVLPGLEVLEDADVLLLSVRRRLLTKDQLALVRRYVEAGKPVVGIRTANHAFAPSRGQQTPEGRDAWLTFDPEVFGGSYHGHHGSGPQVALSRPEGATDHPILKRVELKGFVGHGSLYRVSPLLEGAKPLLMGTIPEQPAEPVLFTFQRADGGRSVYTSLGHIQDFEQPAFRKLLQNAVYWAAEMAVPE